MKRHPRQVDRIQILLRHTRVEGPIVLKCIISIETGIFIAAESSENDVIDCIDIDIPCSVNNRFAEILQSIILIS